VKSRPKRRGVHAQPSQHRSAKADPGKEAEDLPTTAAPSHMGAQVSEARYNSGTGVFGFRQDTTGSWAGRQ
jgi:hypothetical protein